MGPADPAKSPPNEHPALALISDYMKHPGLVTSPDNVHPALVLTTDKQLQDTSLDYAPKKSCLYYCQTVFLSRYFERSLLYHPGEWEALAGGAVSDL